MPPDAPTATATAARNARALAFERLTAPWATAHGFAMLAAAALAVPWRAPWLLAGASALSFSVLVVRSRPWWSADGRFGLPNAVTTLRLSGTIALLALSASYSATTVAAIAAAILALDAIDGWLARRMGATSDFGALYDVEADAMFTLALPVLLWTRGVAGPWVVLAGAWRYVYVLALAFFPAPRDETARSRVGRFAYVSTIAAFVTAFFAPPELGRAASAFGTLAVSASFMLSFWQRYRPAAST